MESENNSSGIRISGKVSIPESQLVFRPIRSQGPGGQHVNKVATGVHLRFDIHGSELPDAYKEGLLAKNDQRITQDGIIVIKAQNFKSREKNKADALDRLVTLIRSAVVKPKKRKPTRPSRASRQKRMDAKTRRGKIKSLRKKPDY